MIKENHKKRTHASKSIIYLIFQSVCVNVDDLCDSGSSIVSMYAFTVLDVGGENVNVTLKMRCVGVYVT